MQQYQDLLYHTKEVECWLTPAKHQFINVCLNTAYNIYKEVYMGFIFFVTDAIRIMAWD